MLVSANDERKNKDLPILRIENNLNTIMKQWYRSLKNSMPLNQYIQLYGFLFSQTYFFERIDHNYI